ncbi:(d)CMP kinase [Loktanella salsilacus]|uniref:(d)CMP kinase n=1 Tax=Loktanella salsilacus TaxID=195913 RepID=UPI00373513B0
MSFVIAIDGPAAAGKGTLAQALSSHFGFAYLDTGLLYRAVGAAVLAGAEPITAARSLDPSDLNPDTLRTQAVADAASRVAAIADVRTALVEFQRSFAGRDGGAVLDGRDIGTVICPDADVKLFVTASAQTRADRRFAELTAKGVQTDPAAILAEVRARDDRDQNRAEAPLIAAADAILIDTTDMTAAQALAQAITIVTAKRA